MTFLTAQTLLWFSRSVTKSHLALWGFQILFPSTTFIWSPLCCSLPSSSDSTFSISLQHDPPSWKAGQSLGQLKRLQSFSRPLALTTYWIGQNVPTRFPINSPCHLGILKSTKVRHTSLLLLAFPAHVLKGFRFAAVGGLSAFTHMYFEVCIDAL